MNKHITIFKKDLEKYFLIEKKGELYELRAPFALKSINITLPFILNQEVATLAGLMPDGSLIKDLRRVYFHQKKDLRKIDLFENTLVKLFSKEVNVLRKKDKGSGVEAYSNSKTLAWFMYYILGIPKSDEEMRPPSWLFNSPDNVKISYLKQAFDMEGTVSKNLSEIRFGVKGPNFAQDIQNLLSRLNIDSHLTYAPRVYQTSPQYRVSIYKKENFAKFRDIGFEIPFLKERFERALIKHGIL